MEQELLGFNDEQNNTNADFIELANENLPDPDQVASEWVSSEGEVLEEPIIANEEDPFAIMPINIADENENFTLEGIIAQIMDINDPMITTPMEIEEDEFQIVAIYGAFPDGPDPPSDQFSEEE